MCLGWLGPLSTRSFILQGASLAVSQGWRRISSSKRGQPPQPPASRVPIFFKPLPMSYLWMSHWPKQITLAPVHGYREAWFTGVITSMIYHSMLCTVILTLLVPNCSLCALGCRSELRGGVSGCFLNFERSIIILYDCWTQCKLLPWCRSQCQHYNDTSPLMLLHLCKAGFLLVAVIKNNTAFFLKKRSFLLF